jgi:hypothetical protein
MRWDFFNPSGQPFSPGDRFLNELVQSRGEDDRVLDRRVHEVLREVRFRKAIEPWRVLITSLFKAAWSQTYGRYRRARSKVHIGAALQSGRLPGAVPSPGPLSTHQFAGYGGGFTGTAVNPAPSPTIGPGQSFEDAGIRAGEVVAYRCWILRDGFLWSAFQSEYKWEPDKPSEGDPETGYGGIHAFKKRLDACLYISDYESDGTIIVSGTVELWGDVYEHTRGYRASRARIKSIDDSPHYDAIALRKQYKLNRKPKKKTDG